VEGLEREELAPVKALAGWRPGTALTESRLVEYQERLLKTGLFEQVAVSLDPDPAQAQAARVLVKVREATLHTATFAIGLTTDTGPHASVEHTYRRVLGLPIIARNKLSWAKSAQSIDSEFSTHRDGKFNRDLIGLVVERTEDGGEISLSQRWRLGRAHDSIRNEWLSFVQAEQAKECDQVSDGGYSCTRIRALSLNRYVIWRELDSVILPTSGYALQMQVGAGMSGENQDDPGPFSRLYARWIGYRPLGAAWYSQARLELGYVLKPGDLSVPDSQLFRAGGDESVRGYSYRSLAPTNGSGTVQGGTTLFTASAELARPVSQSMPSLWWAAFMDAGRAADEWRTLQPALGYGLGLRWRSPVGPLKVDWAWGREVHRARLHINVGLAF
jgi:translocation and assembly module TamA